MTKKRPWRSAPGSSLQDAVDLGEMSYGKIPPQNKEMEMAVLGAIMLEKGAFDIVVGILKPEMFYVPAHSTIFLAQKRLAELSQPIDELTIFNELTRTGQIEEVGGPFYISQLTKNVVSAANIEAHARILVQKFLYRQMIRIGGNLVNLSFSGEKDVFDLMDELGSELFNISSGHLKKEPKPISVAYQKGLQLLNERVTKKEDITGVPSGFPSIDAITYGWQNTDLIIIAARPSVGKTALALQLARQAAYHPHKPSPAAIFSLEMSTGQIIERFMSAESDVKLSAIKRGKIEEWELKTLINKCDINLSRDLIFIDDTPALNIFELRAKARRLVNKHGVRVIIIDYLQLMSGGEGNGNREQEISKISRDLKQLAKELGVPILALSQLSREVEKRGSKEPMLSDLRESGAIEQDADVVAFMWRSDYQVEAHKADPSTAGDTYIKFAKHRNGALETILLKANLSTQKFYDITQLQETERVGNYISMHEANRQAGTFDQTEMPF
jgi:replicative DNA helicase